MSWNLAFKWEKVGGLVENCAHQPGIMSPVRYANTYIHSTNSPRVRHHKQFQASQSSSSLDDLKQPRIYRETRPMAKSKLNLTGGVVASSFSLSPTLCGNSQSQSPALQRITCVSSSHVVVTLVLDYILVDTCWHFPSGEQINKGSQSQSRRYITGRS